MYLFYLIVLLSLGCPHVKGTEVPDQNNDLDLDQVATASENVAQAKVQREKKSKDIREQLIASVSGTVHYENSNGFVPIVPDERPQETGNRCQNSTEQGETKRNTTRLIIKVPELEETIDPEEIENDPAYSTEARLFLNLPQSGTNRRSSYDFQDGTNEFELLKVRNDTPAIANYQEFYQNLQNRVNQERAQEENRLQGGGKPIEYHQVGRNPYQDQERQNHRVKLEGNYHRQEYEGHGQNVAPSLTRTRVKEDKDQTLDNLAEASKTQHRFTRPVVVADLGTYPSRPVDPGPGYKTSRIIEAASSETGQYSIYSRDGRFRGFDDSNDQADDSLDYSDYNDRPRRVQKGRRRPYTDNSQRLPKEHRGSSEEEDFEEVRGHGSRSKGHRHRGKSGSWGQDDRTRSQDESHEQTRYEGRLTGSETKGRVGSRFKPSAAWNQISPNLEISHSRGVEIDQLEKPKLLVPVNVNLVPVTNFDHATALGNSQGFDMSNAVLQNYVTAGPIVTTGGQMYTDNLRHVTRQHQEASTSAPDVIIGQKSVHNGGQTILVPQASDQNKYSRSQYVSSTVAPVFAVTPGQGLQGVSIQNVHATVTPRTTYVASPSPSSNDQVQSSVPHLLLPQPTLQTFPSVLPVQTSPQYSIQVNTHGLHGQNLVNQAGMQNIPIMTTVAPTPMVPVTKVSLVRPDTSGKKTIVSGNNENYYSQYQNALANLKPSQSGAGLYQVVRNYPTKGKAYIQTTHIVPALLQPLPTLGTVQASGHQLVPEQTVQNFVVNRPGQHSGNAETVQQFQLQVHRDQLMKGSANLPGFAYQLDSLASQSNNNANTAYANGAESAHLPNVGTRNVEIANPNLNLSPVQTGAVVNAYEPIQYPTAVLTTPIPMFTTTGFVTARPAIVSTTTPEPISLQSFMDSLSEINNQASSSDLNSDHNQDRQVFNPINFVPNVDLLKSQNALNGKLHDPLQQNLNLVPLIPGGNFFKPSYTAQSELLAKPKLTSDLEKYAEQMFRESLNTIYNSHKWNNDRRRPNVSEIDLAKLRQELQRLRASLPDTKQNKDHYHPSESKIRTTEAHKASLKDQLKSNDQLLTALEQILKSQSAGSTNHRPGQGQRHTDQGGKHFNGGPQRDNKHPRDFMSPPKRHSPHRSKPFHEKGKKRPGPRFNHHHHHHHHHHGSRSRPSTLAPKSSPETAASNLDVHRSPFDTEEPFDHYPTFTTPSTDILTGKQLKNRKYPGGRDFDINHPRAHNLLGLLMKNKQLPPGQGVFRDREQIEKFFEDEKRRLQQQFYDDSMREYLVNGVDGPGGRPFQERNAG